MAMITSAANQHIALLRSLQTAKAREAEGLFLTEGPHLLGAALDAKILPRLLERVADARAEGAAVYEATAQAIVHSFPTRRSSDLDRKSVV